MPAPTTNATLRRLLAIETDDCLIWPHSVTDRGYPQMTYTSRERYAHRAALYETVGPPPPGTEAAHSCGERSCVNPRHLRWATPAENNRDRTKHGTMPRGGSHWSTSITEQDVAEMKRLRSNGMTYKEIGERFGMHRASASRILRGKSWAWLTQEA